MSATSVLEKGGASQFIERTFFAFFFSEQITFRKITLRVTSLSGLWLSHTSVNTVVQNRRRFSSLILSVNTEAGKSNLSVLTSNAQMRRFTVFSGRFYFW